MLRSSLHNSLSSAERSLDRHAKLALFALACTVTIWAWFVSQAKPLWYDEQLGLAAATMPHAGDVTSALALPVDINPPLSHFLERWSINLLGNSATAARLPSFLAMLVFLLCLYLFVSRRLGPGTALLAPLSIVCTPILAYSCEARPYADLLAFTGLALVAYQRRMERRGLPSLLLFLACCACLPLTHYYGLLVLGPFAVAEVLRTRENRRMDWPLAAGMLLVPALVLTLLSSLIHAQWLALARHPPHGNVMLFIAGYRPYLPEAWVICLSIGGLALVHWLQASSGEDLPAERPGLTSPETALALTLLLLPVAGALASKVTHAYVPRYFLPASGGYAILICYVAAVLHRRCAGVVLILNLIAATCFVYATWVIAREPDSPQPMAALLEVLERSKTPVVFEDAKDYLLARDMDPAFADHFAYAADPDLAARVNSSGADDEFMQKLALLQPIHALRLDEMARQSAVWTLVPGPFGWVRQCLGQMGAAVPAENAFGGSPLLGAKAFTLHLPQPDAAPVSWCEAAK